jgi:4-amino-4-deoxy-L-arabinose transferase-like glycosyltransferase
MGVIRDAKSGEPNEATGTAAQRSTSALRPWFVILLVWATATAINLYKPVHLDDTAYLETAHAFLKSPLHPLSQTLNWADSAEPIHHLNQPPLWSVVMAVVMSVFGDSEIALHLTMSLFVGLALLLFHRLARIVAGERALPMTVLFGIGPALLPSQNLMTDVPMLALWLGFFLCLMRAEGPGAKAGWLYPLAALLATAACLTKYTSLPLPMIFVGMLIWRRRWRMLWLVLIPVAGLAAWSALNYLDYGTVHLLARPEGIQTKGIGYKTGSVLVRCLLWVIALGSVSPFVAIALGARWRREHSKRLWIVLTVLMVTTVAFGQLFIKGEGPLDSILRAVFLAAGVALLAEIARRRKGERTAPPPPADRDQRLVLGLWLLGAAAFVIFFSPFMAVRHVLPALPAVLLLLARQLRELPRIPALRTSLVLSAVLGISIAASDWAYANTFRSTVRTLQNDVHARSNVWVLGHWGLQWYAARAGFREYDRGRSVIEPGDVVYSPAFVHAQHLSDSDASRLRDKALFEIPSTPLTWIRTMGEGAGYYYFWWALPWKLTREPLVRWRILEMPVSAHALRD